MYLSRCSTMDRTCAAPDPAAFPDGEEDKRYARYRAVDKDGLCMVGELLDNGTVMINKECEFGICCLKNPGCLLPFQN
jgi:hypothetical protein